MSSAELIRPVAPVRPGTDPVWRLAAIALVLAALNLRPAVTSLGPVLAEARAGLGMSATVAGLLTSIPAVSFALVGFTAPRLARRYGSDGVILAGITVVTLGLALRPLAGGATVFVVLSAAALGGIALVNVLLPVVVKQRFPQRVGTMTGLYSMALSVGASTAAATTVPVARALGGSWRLGLGVWALLGAVALPAWFVLARRRRTVPAPADVPGSAVVKTPVSLWRTPVAWALAGYFGLQATFAYVIIGWLPQIFRDAGLSAETAGLLFALTSLLGVPLSLVLSSLAGRWSSQSGIAVLLGVFGLAGYAGLWAAPAAAPWLWAGLLGVANCSFPLALTMIGLRGRDAATVARLSAFVQCVGYLLSVPGPVVVGALYQHTGGWRTPLGFLAVLMVAQLAAGLVAGRRRTVG